MHLNLQVLRVWSTLQAERLADMTKFTNEVATLNPPETILVELRRFSAHAAAAHKASQKIIGWCKVKEDHESGS